MCYLRLWILFSKLICVSTKDVEIIIRFLLWLSSKSIIFYPCPILETPTDSNAASTERQLTTTPHTPGVKPSMLSHESTSNCFRLLPSIIWIL